MKSFVELSALFETHFDRRHFPSHPESLYDAAQYILKIGGKRVRPVSVLMANELFSEINNDAYEVATAVELFHNFSLIHDDIMDKAPKRRGVDTLHIKFGESTALLSGDVMLVVAYEYINRVNPEKLHPLMTLFSKTAREVCEGQQMDMDFESQESVSLDAYLNMITLKTSVLLAASLQMGAILGGAGAGNQQHIYEFGKNLGIAFQIQDDYLDAFGDPEKFGKMVGGDIMANKKTFLLIHALSVANDIQLAELKSLLNSNAGDKVEKVLQIFSACKVGEWANTLKEKYFQIALSHLEKIAVLNERKSELEKLARYLLMRES
jgi:geranylgeranyl diphosphate synthase type II